MHFRILKIIATSGFLAALECTKFDFCRGSAPDPGGGANSAPPDPLAGLRGPTSKGREGKGRERRGGKKGKEIREGQEKSNPNSLYLVIQLGDRGTKVGNTCHQSCDAEVPDRGVGSGISDHSLLLSCDSHVGLIIIT